MKSHFLLLEQSLHNLFATASIVDPHAEFDLALTSHSTRVAKAYAAIESVCRGPVKPRQVTLFLADEDWSRPRPRSLERLASRGLDIVRSENLGPHTKLQPYLRLHSHFERPLVTIDDDVFYRKDLLKALQSAWRAQPDMIHCARARKVRVRGPSLAPYATWPLCEDDRPSFAHFATGVGGVMYPPAFLAMLKAAGDGFKQACPWADDIWVNKVAVLSGYRVRQLTRVPDRLTDVPGARKTALFKLNLRRGGNDLQLAQTYSHSDIHIIRGART